MVELRVLASDDDWPVWRQARLAALSEAPHAFRARLADWPHGGEDRWRARLTMPGAHNLVAVRDGGTVGMAAGMPGADATYELRSVWVSPRVRGQGVGDLLTGGVEAWARRTGARALRLAVVPGNEAAVALYLRHGFVASGELGEVLG
ncbi:GNAT family N-acetyltransferase, partial [Streptomyces albidoflavus]|uniref:GNAT family N-acetyltransferase n=1 Tax=Streptomyces albidoflavus TaxID=1886 RepID=UPI000BB5BB4B